jgi:O-antigen ligase
MLPDSTITRSRSLSPGVGEWWVVVVLLFSLIPAGMEVPMFGNNISLFDVALLAVVLYRVFRGVVGKFSFDLSDKPVLLLSLAFLITQLISLLFNLRDVHLGFRAVKIFAFGYLTYMLCVSTLKRARDVQRVLLGLIVWGGTVGLLLVYHYITDWSSFFALDADAGGAVKDEVGIALGHSNNLAALLVIILPVAIAALFSCRRFLRIAVGVCVGLILVGLLITMSRGGFLSIVVGLLCAGPMIWKAGLKLRHAAIFLGAVVCFFLLVLLIVPELLIFDYGMLSYRLDNPDYARVDLWKASWEVFLTHPLFGIGPDSIYIYNRRLAIDVPYSHNFILNTLSELGLAGGLSFFLLLGVLIRRSYRLCLSTLADPKRKHIALGLFVGLLSTLAHGLVDPTFPFQTYEIIFWICMALIYSYQQILRESVLAGTADANLFPSQLTPSSCGVRS